MTFKFTLIEMITFLQKRGYSVASEELVEKVNYNGVVSEIPRKCFVTRYRGDLIAEEQGFGTNRLEFCFREEMQRAMLGL